MSDIPKSGTYDEIAAEVRWVKEALAKPFDFDVRRILDDARKRQNTVGRRILKRPSAIATVESNT